MELIITPALHITDKWIDMCAHLSTYMHTKMRNSNLKIEIAICEIKLLII